MSEEWKAKLDSPIQSVQKQVGHLEINIEDIASLQTERCGVCYLEKPSSSFHEYTSCQHRFCVDCIQRAYHDNITSSMISIQCLECKGQVHPEEVKSLVNHELYERYLNLSLRKCLSTIPEVRYCLSPDCPYACILAKVKSKSVSEEDRHFICQREECKREYCNDCKLTWHPDKTCAQARAEAPESEAIPEAILKQLNAKPCPSCKSMIEKMEDGTCNEVKCVVCHTSFCWLCLKPVSEMHFMSPTGCPMFGNQRWSRKKRYCCRLWLWILAPFGTLIVALLLIPVIILALPIVFAYFVYDSKCARNRSKPCRVIVVIIFTIISILLSPLIAILCSLLVIPILIFYAYCFVPVHICVQST